MMVETSMWNSGGAPATGDLFVRHSRYLTAAGRGDLPAVLSAAILDSERKNWGMDPRKIPDWCDEYRVAGAPLGIPKGLEMEDNAGRFIIPSDVRFVTAWHRFDWIIDWLSRSLHVITVPFDHTFIAVAYAADDCRGSPKVWQDKLHIEERCNLQALFYAKQAGAVITRPAIKYFRMKHMAPDHGVRRRLSMEIFELVSKTGFPECSTIFYIDHEAMGVMTNYTGDVRLGGPWWPGHE